MKMRFAVPALAAFLMVPATWAQTGGASAPAAASKVGVIDVQVAITSTAEGKQAAAELQSQFAPRQTELSNMQKQMEDIQTRLRTGQTTLSDDEKARLQREGEQLQRTFQRRSQDAQDDFNEAQREIVDRIGRRMIDVLSKYCPREFVLRHSGSLRTDFAGDLRGEFGGRDAGHHSPVRPELPGQGRGNHAAYPGAAARAGT